MTHPNTLTIPRAVVEQAIAICESLQRYDGTLTGAQVIATVDALRAALQPQDAEPETNDATFGAILFAFVRMSLVYPTEAQLHQLDRLIAFYGDQKFASQLKLLAHQARTPNINRDAGRVRPLVFSGSAGIGAQPNQSNLLTAATEGPPERDHSKPAEHQGVFRKFNVQRADGSDQPGGKHHGCEYFVLDVAHDQHAKPALEAYAVACATTHPQLSADMRERYGLQPQAAAEPVAGYVLVHKKVLNKLGIPDAVVDTIAAQAAVEPHTFNDESPFCVKCGSTGEDAEGPVAHILPRDLEILKFKSMPVPVDPLPYDNGEEKTVPLYTSPPATQAALTAASDCRTCQHLSEAWGVCEARPKCVGGEQYVYFPEKQLWDKTPRNDGQAAHQEMREALYAEFNRAVGRQHD